MDIGSSKAEAFWTEFLRKLGRRGLRGVQLVVSDAHEGLKAAVAKVMHASWQRYRVHFLRNALARAGKSGRRVVSVFIATTFAHDDAAAASSQWRKVAVGIFPNEAAIVRLVRAILLEQNDEWAVQRARYMTLETIAPLSGDPVVGLRAVAA